MHADDWLKQGQFLQLSDDRFFTIDSGVSDKPTLIILHGFPTSSYDYYKVYQPLTENYRVIVHDHLGFGFSDKPPNADYSLFSQTDRAEAIWRKMGINEAVILAHDYGTSILTELLAREAEGKTKKTLSSSIKIQGIVLCNGSMHIEMANLRLMQRLLRIKYLGKLIAKLSSKKTLSKNLKATYFDSSKLSKDEIDAIWQLMIHNQGRNCLDLVSRYTLERQTFWHRWIGALQETEKPIEIIWPRQDPIAVRSRGQVMDTDTKYVR